MPNEQTRDDLSLEQVENEVWGASPPDATRLVTTVHQLRRKPLRTLKPEDLRLLISQQVSLDVLLPRALDLLERDPLLEGDFYPGDVLAAVLHVPHAYWSANPAQRARVERVIATLGQDTGGLDRDIAAFREQLANGASSGSHG